MTVNSPKLNEALNELRRQMEAIVREEQLRDQLTGLANNLALSEKLKSAIEDRIQFWCAIIEVDYFKRINDIFTYAVADGLLQKIAVRLKLFEDYVPGAFAVRAHGDEFYLIGSQSDAGTETKIADSLDQIRKEIEKTKIRTDHGEMGCTVSIGWMTTNDAGESVLVERTVMGMLEAAVGAAKIRGRNQVVRYSPEIEKAQRRSVRDDCANCGATFTVEIPSDTPYNGELHCPNCGGPRDRPPAR